MEAQGGRGYMGNKRGNEVQVSAFVFYFGYSYGRYVFLITSLFSEVINEKVGFLASLFSTLKVKVEAYKGVNYVYPTLSVIRE